MRVAILLFCLFVLAITVAAQTRVTLYERSSSPPNWSRLSRADKSAPVSFTAALIQHNWNEFTARVKQITNPYHEDYTEYMTFEEITKMTGPTDGELADLYSSLSSFGIPKSATVLKGDTLVVNTNVAAAENLFQTEFYNFQHSNGQKVVRQFGAYSLPSDMNSLIRLILGVSTFPAIEGKQIIKNGKELLKQRITAAAPQAQSPAWVPQAIQAQYSFPLNLKPGSHPGTSAGVIEFIYESFNRSDLTLFSKAVDIPVNQPSASHIHGNESVGSGQTEASLDIQWLEGVNPGITPWFWLEPSEDWLYSFTADFLAAKTYPEIISMSYGLPELIQCSFFGNQTCQPLGVDYQGYILATNAQFEKMAALGVTSIVCSQDRGVYLPQLIPGFTGQLDENGQVVQPFEPEYPGTSDWVTSVGATEFGSPEFNVPNPPPVCSNPQYQCVSGGIEQAVSYNISFYKSGGGFSNVTPRPSYQVDAVKAYLDSGVELPANKSVWNQTARGYPDVSALGYNAVIYDNGYVGLVSGTSESTPIFAAIFALLSDNFKQKTGKGLGFINPLIYTAALIQPDVFRDITIGDNCEATPCAGTGFFAYKGWDPVTGLGTPNYKNFAAYIDQLADKVLARRAAKQLRGNL